jgi:hypothetical protein
MNVVMIEMTVVLPTLKNTLCLGSFARVIVPLLVLLYCVVSQEVVDVRVEVRRG